MPATVTITRPTYLDTDTLDAAAANGVWILSATVPSATNVAEGVIQLAGDLAGTATAPEIGPDKVTTAKMGVTADVKTLLGAANLAAIKTQLGITTAEQRARCTSDLAKAADTTFADAAGLTANVVTGITYSFEVTLFIVADTTGATKWKLTGTAAMTSFQAAADAPSQSSNYLAQLFTAFPASATTDPNVTSVVVHLAGTFTPSADGTFQVQFAQQTASGTSTLKAGSFMRVLEYS